jgi:predicted AlkP superfamily phosphohydrolase/phosphomutase
VQAPDIIVGYNKDYRVSWEAAIGQPTDSVFHDNTKAWSGDHCIDPKLIPGVFFCNRKIESEQPRLMDLGPTVLDLFGVDVPHHMDGKPLSVSIPGNSKRRPPMPSSKVESAPRTRAKLGSRA